MAGLDFSPLDFRNAILADQKGRIINKTIENISDIATGAIRERQARKEKLKKDFVDQMTYDTAITGNNIINNRVAYEYEQLRNKHLKVMQDKRGWLTPEDTINLRSDMQGLISLASQLKSVQNMYDSARQAATSKEGRDMYDLDTEKWGDLMEIISGEKDTTNLIGELNNITQSDTEFPFLNFQMHDILSFENDLVKPYRQTYAGDTKQAQSIVEKGGKQISSTVKTTDFGTENDAKDFFKANLLKLGQSGMGYIKDIQAKLTPEEKNAALIQYGPGSLNRSDTPYLDYYIDNKFDPQKLIKEKEEKKYLSKPTTKAGGLSLFFGGAGQKPEPGQYVPRPDNVEGVKLKEYVEFGRAGISPKNLPQVTVKGAQRINRGNVSEPVNLNRISDYKVAGYDLDRNRIILTQKENIGGYPVIKTFMVPYKGNENFLDKVFDDETLKEIQRRANIPYKEEIRMSDISSTTDEAIRRKLEEYATSEGGNINIPITNESEPPVTTDGGKRKKINWINK